MMSFRRPSWNSIISSLFWLVVLLSKSLETVLKHVNVGNHDQSVKESNSPTADVRLIYWNSSSYKAHLLAFS